MSDGIELSGYAALTRPTMLMLQAGLDNKAAAALLVKPPQPRGEPVGLNRLGQFV